MTADSLAASAEGVVARVDFNACAVLLDDGALLATTVRPRLMGRRKALGNTVVVGDRVRCETLGEAVSIVEVAPRRNAFSRRASGRQPVEQVVGANLDQVLVVAAFADPEFSAGFTDRVLCQAEHAGLPARLLLNKVDLAEATPAGRAEVRALVDDYARAGYAVHAMSARTGAGIEELRQVCRGHRSLFVGHSGVGKSTLLNALVPGLDLLVGRVNAKTGKGRHTTTAAWLVRPEPGFELIDTPGMRAFGLWGIEPRTLDQAWAEFRPFLGACRFADCAHGGEPGCAVSEAVDAGRVAARRLGSYRKLREELEQEAAPPSSREGTW